MNSKKNGCVPDLQKVDNSQFEQVDVTATIPLLGCFVKCCGSESECSPTLRGEYTRKKVEAKRETLHRYNNLVPRSMNKNSNLIPAGALLFLTWLLSGALTSSGLVFGQNFNQMTAASTDQLASNLTRANSDPPIKQQLKAEILVPIFYNNGTSVQPEKYTILFEELVRQFGAVSSEDNNVINGYWINPQDNRGYADRNKVYWLIVPDTEENRQYFVNLQNKLESLFEQESILIYFTPVLNLLSE
jgi:hypothetical protein